MSTVAEISEAIPQLTNRELQDVEQKLIQEYRRRKVGLIYDDSYGTWTEEDLRAIQGEALSVIDGELPSK